MKTKRVAFQRTDDWFRKHTSDEFYHRCVGPALVEAIEYIQELYTYDKFAYMRRNTKTTKIIQNIAYRRFITAFIRYSIIHPLMRKLSKFNIR